MLNRMGFIEIHLEELKSILPDQFDNYNTSLKTKLATERILHIIIEAVLDICIRLVKHLQLGLPSSDLNSLDLLSSKLESIGIIKDLQKLRNVLVHQYSAIDHSKIFKFALNLLTGIPKILNDIRQYL